MDLLLLEVLEEERIMVTKEAVQPLATVMAGSKFNQSIDSVYSRYFAYKFQ